MIEIKTGDQLLLLRFNNYKKHSFIHEHLSCIKDDGSVWILKIGRKIPATRMESILNAGGVLILKGPKADGGKYYIAHFIEHYFGNVRDEMSFPKYYYEMERDENIWNMENGLFGTWIHVDIIRDLPSNFVHDLHLLSNGKSVEQVLSQTMSSMMYIQSSQDFII